MRRLTPEDDMRNIFRKFAAPRLPMALRSIELLPLLPLLRPPPLPPLRRLRPLRPLLRPPRSLRPPRPLSLVPLLPLVLFGATAAGAADPYPSQPIKLVVPYVAGGPTDVYARGLGKNLAEALATPVIVENKGGAATMIGAEAVARAPNDGYTLLFSVLTTFSSNPFLYKKMAYKIEDFAPISVVATGTFVIAVGPSIAAKNVAEFVAYSKANPGKVAMGSLGIGTGPDMVGKTFARLAGLDLIDVPYKGSAAALNDLLGGSIAVYFDGLASALAQHKAGKLRILAVAGNKRSPVVPDVPTFAELGYPDLAVPVYWALFAPAGTPKDVVARLNAATMKAANEDTFKSRLLADGVTVETTTPEGLAEVIRNDSESWKKLITPLNIPAQ